MSFWVTLENSCKCKSKFRGYLRNMPLAGGGDYFADCSTCSEEIRVPFQAAFEQEYLPKNAVELRTYSKQVSS